MKSRTYYEASQWKAWILEHKNSGITIKEWCLAHGVNTTCFFRWRKRLVDQGELVLDEEGPGIDVPNRRSDAPAVVQVNSTDLGSRQDQESIGASSQRASLAESILASQIVIEAPASGCRIYVGTGFSQETLRRVMEVMG